MKILIAYDGSKYADKAVDDLKRAGLPREAEAIVMSVADVIMPPAPPEASETIETVFTWQVRSVAPELIKGAAEAVDLAHATALQGCQRVQENFPGWAVKAEAVGDSPAWAIIKKADEWNPDLIVVGSHGRSAPGRFFLGSISQKVANEARCSVRIARSPNREAGAPLRIVIGMDGSPGAEAALAAVATREWPRGTEARVIAVLDLTMSTSIEWVQEGDEEMYAWVRRMVDASVKKLQGVGLEASFRIIEGDASHVLVREAEYWGADTIFVGARGLRRLERFFLGSVSSAVAVRSHCSVEIARAKQTA